MAGCNHNGTVKTGFREYDRHKHGRRGRKPAVKRLRTLYSQPLEHLQQKRRSRNARIMSNTDFQFAGRLARALRQPQRKRLCDQVGGFPGQIDLLPLNALHSDAAHIAAVLQLQHQFL